MTLTLVHDRLSLTALMYIVILGVWGLWRYFRGQGLAGSFWGALVVAEIVILIQGLLGGYLWISGLRPLRGGIHILYGITSALVIPGVFAFTRGESDRRVMLIYAIALLFLAGLIIRGISTGGA
ncbi:MAG: hypothetical protein ACK2UW_10620 [Anaerolineales bacterium]